MRNSRSHRTTRDAETLGKANAHGACFVVTFEYERFQHILRKVAFQLSINYWQVKMCFRGTCFAGDDFDCSNSDGVHCVIRRRNRKRIRCNRRTHMHAFSHPIRKLEGLIRKGWLTMLCHNCPMTDPVSSNPGTAGTQDGVVTIALSGVFLASSNIACTPSSPSTLAIS